MPIDLEGNGEDAPLFNRPFVAEITAKSGTTPIVYSWKEVVPEPGGTGYEDADPGRTGDATSQPAYELNNVDLDVGTLVRIHCRGVQDEELTFGIEAPGLGGSLAVAETDGSPSYAGITTLQFNSSYFTLTQPAAGTAAVTYGGPVGITVRESDGSPSYPSTFSLGFDQSQGAVVTDQGSYIQVSWANATASQAGVVSTGTQTIGGAKTFADDATFSQDVLVSGVLSASGSVFNQTAGLVATYGVSGSGWAGSFTGAIYGVGMDSYLGLAVGPNDLSWDAGAELTHGLFILTRTTSESAWPAYAIRANVSGSATTRTGQSGTFNGLDFTGGLLTGGSGGGVSSVDASGGTTGLSFSGGPVTSTGTLTMAGTLAAANGGTGLASTPGAGTLLTGTGSGYAQSSALAFATMWGVD